MTTMTLSQSTPIAITNAVKNGPGANNQNDLNAYNAIYANINANGGFNAGAVSCFSQSGLVNTRQFAPSAAGAYIYI
jgi:hypothetical protein